MKTRYSLLCALLVMMPAGQSFAALKHLDKAVETISKEILRSDIEKGAGVAVLPFRTPQGEVSVLGRMVADRLTEEIVKSRCCTTLDRDYVSQMLDELKMGLVGLTDQRTALQVGKMSGARYLLTGVLEPYGQKEISVQARLLETETSRLVATSRAKFKMDKDLQELYSRKAALDAAATGLLKGIEPQAKPEADSAVLLNQTGKDGCSWVESRAETPLKGDIPMAKALAVASARQKAMRKLNIGTSRHMPDFEEGAFHGRLEDVLRSIQSGRIAEEKVVEEKSAGPDFRLVLQTCWKPSKEVSDKGFKVELMLNQNRFMEGQEARAILVSDRDAYVYIYSVDFDQNALRVFPIPAASQNKLSAGKPFTFPDDEHQKAGIKLVAELPKGAADSVETLRVLAVKSDAGSLLEGAKTYPDIVRALDAAGEEWAEDVRVFTIYKR